MASDQKEGESLFRFFVFFPPFNFPGFHPMTYTTESEARQWATFLHLSLLAGLLLPGAGFILPIILWQLKKDELPGIDAHGKVVVNWLISALIYGAVGGLLVFVLIGFPLLAILGLVSLIFPIIGAIKANEGVLWRYPLSLRIFS
ncbi:DUF4870 domain-containing protein [Hymenobacter jeollabukensis]|nr:DUF4870 domain-containing protein [Hymenobacter jeollabukensis]